MECGPAIKPESILNSWRRTVSQIPSVFGRMVYLSSLREPNSGRYCDYGLASFCGERDADQTIREAHERSFSEWLSFTLEEQMADLQLYFSELAPNRRTILETWKRLAPYRNLVPIDVEELERQLYLADLHSLLDVLNNENGAERPDGG